MASVDKRTVQMEFDNAQFESGVHTTLSTLDKLKQALSFKGGADGLKAISDEASQVNLNPISEAAQAVSNKFSVLGTIADQVLRRITDSALNTGKQLASAITTQPIVDGFHEYETQIGAIQTISANTGLKGEKGIAQINAALDDLNTYADKTIYNFTEMTRNIGTFTAAGIDLDRSKNAIKGIANLGAISGSTSAQVSNAMYQLSQALAAGKVNLMDWNSVVNAGMGGKVFQNALLRTGEMMGRINKKTAEGIKNGKKSFRESISGKDSWLDADILEETLNELSGVYSKADLIGKGYTESQADDILELAKTGEEAATKVKTFSQLIDTLKEALGSGWTTSWRTIIGDFNDAEKLWTGISNVLSDAINDSANARNAILNDWAELGGRTAILNGLKNVWESFVAVIKPVKEAFRDIFPATSGKQLADYSKAFENFTKKLKPSEKTIENIKNTFKGLFSVIDIVVQGFGAVVKAIFPAFTSLGSFGDGILSVTGALGKFISDIDAYLKKHKAFERATKALRVIFAPIGAVITLAGKALNKFGSLIGDVASQFEKFGKPVTSFLKTIKENIQKVKEPFSKLEGPVSKVSDSFQTLKEAAHDLYSAVGEKLSNAIDNLTKVFNPLEGVVNGVGSAFTFFAGGIATVVGWISKLTSGVSGLLSGGLSKVSGAIGGIGKSSGKEEKKASGIGAVFGNIGKAVSNTFSYLGKYIQDFIPKTAGLFSKIGSAIQGFFLGIIELGKKAAPVVGSIFSKIGDGLSKLAKVIGGKLSKIKFSDVIKTAMDAMMGIEGLGMVDNFRKILGKFADGESIVDQFFGTIKEIFGGLDIKKITDACSAIKESLIDTFSALQTQLKAKTLMTIAGAIAIMAGSILLLSGIDPKQLAAATTAVGAGMAELVGAFKAIDKLKIDSSGMTKIAFSMILMAAAIGVLSLSMKKLSSMSWDEIVKGLVSVIGLMAAMTIVAKLLSSTTSLSSAHGIAGFFDNVGAGLKSMFEGNQYTKAAKGMILMAVAIRILAGAVEKLGKLSLKQLAKGLGSVAAMLIMLVAAVKILSKVEGVKGAGTIMVLAIAMAALVKPIEKLSKIKASSLAKALLAVGAALGMLVAAVYILGNKIDNSPKGAMMLLALAAAMNALVPPIQKLSQIKFSSMAKALIGIGSALGILVASVVILSKLDNGPKGVASIVILTAVMNALVPPIQKLSQIKFLSMAKALIGIASALGVMVGAVFVLSKMKDSPKGIASIAILAVVMNALVPPIEKLSKIKFTSMAKALIGIGASLGILVGSVVILSKLNGSVKGAGTLIILAGVMTSLVPPIEKLSKIKFTSLAKSLMGIAGALTILIAAMAATSKVKGSAKAAVVMLIMVSAINALVPAIEKLSKIKFSSLTKSLLAIGVALGEMAIVLGVVAEIKGTTGAAVTFLIMAAAINALVPAIQALSAIKWTSLVKSLGAITVLLAGLTLTVSFLKGSELTLLAFSAALVGLGAGLLLAGAGVALFGEGINLIGSGLIKASEAITGFAEGLGGLVMSILQSVPQILQIISESLTGILNIIITNAPLIGQTVMTLIEMILTVIRTEVPNIAETIVELLTAILEILIEYAPIIVTEVGELITQVLYALAEQAPKIIEALTDLIVAVLECLADSIPRIIDAAVDLIVAFVEAIADNLDRIVDAAFDVIVAFINALADGISEHSGDLLDAADNLIHSFVEFLGEAVGTAVGDLPALAADFVKGFVDGVQRAADDSEGLSTIADFGKSCLDKLAEVLGINSPSKETYAQAQDFTAGFNNGINDSDAETAPTSFGQKALNALQGVFSGAASLGKGIFGGISSGIQNGAQVVSGGVSTVVQGASKAVSGGVGLFKKGGSALVNAVGGGISAGAGAVKTIASGAAKGGASAVSATVGLFKTGGSALVNGLKTTFNTSRSMMQTSGKTAGSAGASGIKGTSGQFRSAGSSVAKTGASGVSSGRSSFKSGGSSLGSAAASGISSKSGAARSAASGVARSAASGLNAGRGSAHSSGSSLMSGFISGINSMAGRVMSTASSLASRAAQKIKSALKIGSPSRITRSYGQFFSLGLAYGMEDRINTIVSKASKAATSATSAFIDSISYKDSREAGNGYGKSFINGFEKSEAPMIKAASKAATAMSTALNSEYSDPFTDADISSLDPYSINDSPVISPVIDFTNIKDGANQINQMLSSVPNVVSSSWDLGKIVSPSDISNSINASLDNFSNDDVVNAVNSLKSDIESLGDRISKLQIILDTGVVAGGVTDQISYNINNEYNKEVATWA